MPLLNIFGELETFIADDLYPYRYVITPILIVALLAALYAAYRLGLHLTLLRHKVATAAVGVPLLAVTIIAGDYLVSPLWERSHLEEASPLAATGVAAAGGSTSTVDTSETPEALQTQPTAQSTQTTGGSGASTAAFQPTVVQRGEFVGADDFHFGRGNALIIETEPGKYVLRFEDFSVRNGPDLYVYLSKDPTGEEVDEALNLGELKATDGAFNYEIPAEIDVSRVKSAVVWCRQFSVLFTHAGLSAD